MPDKRYLTAREAARRLGVQLPTLYAYVSRGLVRSEGTGTSKRVRRYSGEDVERLRERQEQRRNPARAAETALNWGAPVMDSALTLIDRGRLFYRGMDAVELAGQRRFEEVAALLWTGDISARPDSLWNGGPLPDSLSRMQRSGLASGLSTIEQFQVVLPVAAAKDTASFDLRPKAVSEAGGRILRLLTAIAAGRPQPGSVGMAETLAREWAPREAGAAGLINSALVLCADHELNISSFTARCVASAGSTPYAVVDAGLCALQGPKHGGDTRRVAALFDEVRRANGARQVLVEKLRLGESIPGFGHPLYPEGDPRGRALLDWIREARPRAKELRLARDIEQAAGDLIGEEPTIDLALVLLARVLRLPRDAPITIFALGRTAGWIAHALEQYQSNQLIRPRARYIGAPRAV